MEAHETTRIDKPASDSAGASTGTDVHSELTHELEKSLQEREAIIKLLQVLFCVTSFLSLYSGP